MIDFLKYRTFGLFFFVAMVVTFVSVYVYRVKTRGHAFTYSIEFTGGTQVLLAFSKPVESSEVSKILEQENLRTVVREFSKQEFLVRISHSDYAISEIAEKVKTSLEEKLSGNVIVTIQQVENVGAGIGSTMWNSSLKALFFCLLVMLLYILSRFFLLGFAVGAVGALFHDALAILTVCLIFDYEISTSIITAILLVLGYSINDTIIIFARIRENSALLKTRTLAEIVNLSINETMRRTLLTTLSTLLTVVALLIFGGPQFRTLSLMLLVGFVFGTYSSIYIASPLMMLFNRQKRA